MKKASVILSVLLAVLMAGCVTARPPAVTSAASASRPAATARASQAPSIAPATRATPAPSETQILAAFKEIAFTSEYGNADRQIRKWTKAMAVAVHGNPTDEDRAALKRAMDGLNGVAGFPGIRMAAKQANVDVWFVKLSELPGVVPGYEPGNWGYFTTHYDSGGITDATVGIASDVTDQNTRNHLIFEELMQSTGLMQDLYDYPDSIFYGGWTTVQQPLPMDWEMLRLLYLPGIRHGMGEDPAMKILKAENKE